MHLYGYGTKLDYKKALKCFRDSARLYGNNTVWYFSEIFYKDIYVLLAEEYLKKVAMFEAMTEQLDLEDKYELGLIYYHGVNPIPEDSNTNETRIIIKSDRVKSSEYFRMIVKGQLSGKISQ
jgi:TPR repeat protein